MFSAALGDDAKIENGSSLMTLSNVYRKIWIDPSSVLVVVTLALT